MFVRVLALVLAMGCCGCDETVLVQWQTSIDTLERAVVLPEGGGKVACYERHYTMLSPRKSREYLGFEHPALANGLLVGAYVLPGDPGSSVGKPGRYRASDLSALPSATVQDAGCSVLTVVDVVARPSTRVPAMCGLTIAGDVPERIVPPVRC